MILWLLFFFFLCWKFSLGHLWWVRNSICECTLTELPLYLGEWPLKPFASTDSFQWGWNRFLRTADLVPNLGNKFYLILNLYAFVLVYFSYKLIWAYLVLLIYYWYCFVTLLINLDNFPNYTSNNLKKRFFVLIDWQNVWCS